MNKLADFLLTNEDIEDVTNMIDSFELQEVKSAIGHNAFSTIMMVINNLKEEEDKIIVLSSLDKLLNTNRGLLVNYDSDYTTLRKKTNSELKKELIGETVEDLMYTSVDFLVNNYEDISQYEVVINTLITLNLIYLMDDDNTFGVEVGDEGKEVLDYIKEKELNILELVNKFENLENNYHTNKVQSMLDTEDVTIKDVVKLLNNL
jgi:GTP-binding protein EngB required for normal cell division